MGIIEYVNEEVFNLLGFSPSELIGKDINTIIPRVIAKDHTKLLV
jgi:PAS domain S-box-containing protein